jgi:hypothetical protein
MIPKIKIKTKEEKDALLSLLGEVTRKIFSEEDSKAPVISDDWNRFSWFGDIKVFFKSLESGDSDYDTYTQEIKNISSWLADLPVIKLALPFEPTKHFVESAYETVSGLEPNGLILDIILDKSILSGGKLFFRGQYVDLTLRSRINYLLSNENAISKYL